MHEPVTVGEVIINQNKWDALPVDIEEIVKTTVQATSGSTSSVSGEDSERPPRLIKRGVKVIKTTDELNERFLQVYDE